MYGNGGLSSWTKTFVQNMRTHENTDGRDETQVEFCYDPLYWPMHDCYSTTYPNGSEFHAWRAGFREGVKMCLNKGAKPSLTDFKQRVHQRNLDHLTIWHNVGSDVDYGLWAIAGSRMGTYMTMLTEWDYKQVQDYNTEYTYIKGKIMNNSIQLSLLNPLSSPFIGEDSGVSGEYNNHIYEGGYDRNEDDDEYEYEYEYENKYIDF